MAKNCECRDTGCKAHRYNAFCLNDANTTLYRVDMDDHSGVPFCEECAEDAMSVGYYTPKAS